MQAAAKKGVRVPKLTRAQLKAIEVAKLKKLKNRNNMVAKATIYQTRKL